MFRDVTTLWQDAKGFRRVIHELVQPYAGTRIDKVLGIEARGFVIGGAVAHQLSVGFVPARKKGKLPWNTVGENYDLEYDNEHWLIQSHGHRSPNQFRRDAMDKIQAAA